MSKKGKDTPTSTRIRDNQRRARMRRTELIASLQERVRQYEASGVQATQEMQRAALKVAQENARLRSLLARTGVREDEVQQYLGMCEEGGDRWDDGTVGIVVHSRAYPGATTSTTQIQAGRTQAPPQPSIQGPHTPIAEASLCPNTDECFCPLPPTSTPSDPYATSGLEISCEAAAKIIADMRGDGDREAVREALGCRGEEECRVRNSEVLGMLGER